MVSQGNLRDEFGVLRSLEVLKVLQESEKRSIIQVSALRQICTIKEKTESQKKYAKDLDLSRDVWNGWTSERGGDNVGKAAT